MEIVTTSELRLADGGQTFLRAESCPLVLEEEGYTDSERAAELSGGRMDGAVGPHMSSSEVTVAWQETEMEFLHPPQQQRRGCWIFGHSWWTEQPPLPPPRAPENKRSSGQTPTPYFA